MLPSELGFKDQTNWRPHQYATIERILHSKSKFIVLSAPTGAGKSVIALGVAQAAAKAGLRTAILTKDTRLQDQYKSYQMENVKVGMGRRNFQCVLEGHEHKTAEEAPCVHEEGFECPYIWRQGLHSSEVKCPYYKQRTAADESQIRVLNYPFFFLGQRAGLFNSDIIICDEGHNVDKEVLNLVSVKLTEKNLDTLWEEWRLKWPKRKSEILKHNPQMISMARMVVTNVELMPILHRSDAVWEVYEKCRKIMALENLHCYVGPDLEFKPILPNEFAREWLLKRGKVVLMSATIFGAEYWRKRLGADEVEYIEIPSTFPVENRPIHVEPVAFLSHKDFTDGEWRLKKMAKRIDEIIASHLPKKGIIHTVSYKRALDYMDRSIFKSSGLLRLGQTRQDIQDFIHSDMGVLVSPSITEGIDLPDELCEFVIWMKVPFPNLLDPVVRLQREDDPGVYDYETVSTIVQGSGRGMRHEGDHCDIYILDAAWGSMYNKAKGILPEWWKAALDG